MTAGIADEKELIAVLQAYNEVAERLKRSHEGLADEVCRLRQELNEKNVELQRRERLSALGQMAAGVAHEIRNPLGGIGLFASVLERDLTDRPAQREIARRIGAGVQNLETIVRDILAFAGGATPKFEDVELAGLLEGVAAGVEPLRASLGIRIEIDKALPGLSVIGDPGLLERAFSNLIFNAVEAAGAGGRVWVRRGNGRGGVVEILVEDDGPGIDPKNLGKIFNPFFTTKDNGTGLGLAIVHGIAESHRGQIRAGNREGRGASFCLILPAAKSRNQSPDSAGKSEYSGRRDHFPPARRIVGKPRVNKKGVAMG